MLALIATIVCFMAGVYLLIKAIQESKEKETKNEIKNYLLAMLDFIMAGINLYIFIK